MEVFFYNMADKFPKYPNETHKQEHDNSSSPTTKRVSLYGWDVDNTKKVKVGINSDGELKVTAGGHISTLNSTTTILDPAGVNVFTGASEDIKDISAIIVSLKASHASATDGLSVQFSPDGTNWDNTDDFTIPADKGKTFSFQPAARYMRVVYTNGAVKQTSFRLQTILKHTNVKPSSHRISDAIIDDDDAELVTSVLKAKANGGGYVNIEATAANNLRVTDAESIFAISKGDVVGTTTVHKFGKNEDVAATFEPLSIGAFYQTPQVAAATTVRVKAGGNAADIDTTGDGARKIVVQGLDETGALVSETISTNGEDAGTAGSITFIRIFRAYVSESGVYAGAGVDSMAASVTIEDSGGDDVWAIIHKPDIGRSQSQIGQYTVPLGKTAFVFSYLLTTDSNKTVDFLFFQRGGILDAAAPYQARRTVVEEIGVQGHLNGTFEGGQAFGELTDIGWMCKAAAAAQVTVDFEIVLVDN